MKLKRSKKYGVGKEIAGKVYLHKRYEFVLYDEQSFTKAFHTLLEHNPEFEYSIVKLDSKTGNVSFIQCPEFDKEHEPAVGDTVTVRPDGKLTLRKALKDPYVYHHKWLFVGEGYDGFDLEESMKRSEIIEKLEVNKSKIGKKSAWDKVIKKAPNLR